jgi:hypothetical protein
MSIHSFATITEIPRFVGYSDPLAIVAGQTVGPTITAFTHGIQSGLNAPDLNSPMNGRGSGKE